MASTSIGLGEFLREFLSYVKNVELMVLVVGYVRRFFRADDEESGLVEMYELSIWAQRGGAPAVPPEGGDVSRNFLSVRYVT